NYVPKIYYLQNGAFEYDMDNHLLPFLTDLQHMPDGCEINNIKVDLYYNPKLKHAAVSKQETIDYVNMAKNI
ncbi:glycosyl transferase family 2, partial [Priestia megaterium]